MSRAALRGALLAALVCWLTGCGLMRAMTPIDSPPSLTASQLEALAPAPRSTDQLQALLLVSAEGTEIYDLLAPFEVLAASGAFEVATVGASRDPHPLTGRIAIVPDFSFADAPEAELLVVPAVANPNDEALLAFLRERAPSVRIVLSVCEGARLVARAGLLDGRTAATHFFAVDSLDDAYPATRFVHGHRFVWDDPVLSSAGVSAALDASLEAVAMLAGEEVARTTAREIGAEWHREDDPSASVAREAVHRIGAADAMRLLRSYLTPSPERVAVWLRPGASEIAIAATLDALPRTLRAQVDPVADSLAPLRTRHGLTILPSRSWESLGAVDLVAIPGPVASAPEIPAAARTVTIGSPRPGNALREVLGLIESEISEGHARTVATMLELPLGQSP